MDERKTVKVKINWFVFWIIGWLFTYGYAIGLDMAQGVTTTVEKQVIFSLISAASWPIWLGIMLAGG